MATLDKEIKVIAVKGQKGDNGQDGKSSYELAVEELHYSGTLEEWIETYATPENYVTRNEFKKVTQAEYDALEQAGELIPDCYYIITDDETYDELIERIENIESDITEIQEDITTKYNDRVYTREVLLATPDLSDDTGWINFQSGTWQDKEFALDTLIDNKNMLEVKGLLRWRYESLGTTIYRVQEFNFRVFSRGTDYSQIEDKILIQAGNVENSVLAYIMYALNISNNVLETATGIALEIGSSPLTTSNIDFKIVSVKELVNY